MAFAKVIFNGTTLMDVTQDTVESSNLLSGNQATKNDGTKVQGALTTVTTSPLSVTENGTYTAPSGTAYTPVTVNVSGGGGSNWISGIYASGGYIYISPDPGAGGVEQTAAYICLSE